jgi:hypothetical protein
MFKLNSNPEDGITGPKQDPSQTATVISNTGNGEGSKRISSYLYFSNLTFRKFVHDSSSYQVNTSSLVHIYQLKFQPRKRLSKHVANFE